MTLPVSHPSKRLIAELVDAVDHFMAVAYPVGAKYEAGERYAYWQARKRLLKVMEDTRRV